MWKKARALSDEDLATIWDALEDYDPRDYFDAKSGILMDDWAECIASVMDDRGIPHYHQP
jgi:hypothetical protein